MFKKLMKDAGEIGKGIAEEHFKIDLDGDGQIGGSKMSTKQARDQVAGMDDGANIPLSTCDGNKKSLFIGINYRGSSAELRGCINDVVNIKQFVVENWHFPTDEAHMKTLTDDTDVKPTRANILAAFQWLVAGAQSGDSLFFHYSGHGGHQKDSTENPDVSSTTIAECVISDGLLSS